MWFNNLVVYQLQTPFTTSPETMHNALEEFRLKSCPPHARLTQGFMNPFIDSDEKTYTICGAHVLVAASETRLLPASVIRAVLDEKLRDFELNQQRPMRRAEQLQLKEEIEFDLLPKAFTVQKKDWFYIDTLKNWVVINSANPNKASEVMSLLIKALGSISAVPLTVDLSFSVLFASWLREPQTLPAGLSLGRQCILINTQDDKSQYSCKDIEQNGNEIDTLLEQGYCVTSLELNWQDRVQFVLTDNFVIKRLKCIDYLQETVKENAKMATEHEKFDANFSLLAGEVRELMTFLIKLCENTNTQSEASMTAGITHSATIQRQEQPVYA